jgi:catalase
VSPVHNHQRDGLMRQVINRGKANYEPNTTGGGCPITASRGGEFLIEFSLLTASSVLFDAVYVPGGEASIRALGAERDAVEFVTEAYRHCKAVAATAEGIGLIAASTGLLPPADGEEDAPDPGLILDAEGLSPRTVRAFLRAVAAHRNWERRGKNRLVSTQGGELRGEATL